MNERPCFYTTPSSRTSPIQDRVDYVMVREEYVTELEKVRQLAYLLAACVLEPLNPRRAEAVARARGLGLID